MRIRYDITVIILLTTSVLIAHRAVCETADKWEWEAGRILFANKGVNNCIKRCQILSEEMRAEGVTHFIVSGFYRKRAHRWIERRGKILDPSQSITSPDLYEAVTKVRVPGNDYPPEIDSRCIPDLDKAGSKR